MPRFQVLLHGSGFRTEIQGVEGAVGFYTTRFVDADSAADATKRAVERFRHEKRFRQLSRGLPSECIAAEEVHQVTYWKCRFSAPHGLAFYRQEADACGEGSRADVIDDEPRPN